MKHRERRTGDPCTSRVQWVGLALLLALPASPVHAQTSAARPLSELSIDYQVPPNCPTRDHFLEQLERRFTSRLARDVIGVRVRVSTQDSGYLGTLLLKYEGSPAQQRDVAGASCEEVVDAVAVVTAIAVRGEEARVEADSAAEVRGEEAPNERKPVQPKTTPAATPRAPIEPPKRFVGSSPIGPDSRHRRFEVEAGTVSVDVATSLTAQAGATFGLIDGVVLPRYELVARSALFLTKPDGSQEMLGLLPLVRVGFSGLGRHTFEGNATQVYAIGFDMGMCYTPRFDTAGWIFLGCVGYGGGIVGLDPVGPGETEGAGFGRVSVELQTEYNFSQYVHLGVRLGVESYLFGDGSELSRQVLAGDGSPIVPFTTLGLGFHF